MKLASALYNGHYPFKEMGLFNNYTVVLKPDELDKDSCLVVWGGGDISPTLYNKPVSQYTGADAQLSKRDYYEWELMCRAQELEIPIIGICRGAQMLCALAGGWLVQDVTNHGEAHDVITDDGRRFQVSSLHHQMMVPFEVDHQLVAWSKHNLSSHYLDVDTPVDVPVETEFVYFPQQKGIAIQWHPEYMRVDSVANAYVKEKVKEYIREA
jgi:putative glutamine amidotransferase